MTKQNLYSTDRLYENLKILTELYSRAREYYF